MVVAAQVQQPMKDKLRDLFIKRKPVLCGLPLGLFHGNHHIPERRAFRPFKLVLPAGNDSTSVVPLLCRHIRLRARIALSDTKATVTPDPFAGTTFKAFSVNARQRSPSKGTLRWRLTTSTISTQW
jgi:hypothetical protein